MNISNYQLQGAVRLVFASQLHAVNSYRRTGSTIHIRNSGHAGLRYRSFRTDAERLKSCAAIYVVTWRCIGGLPASLYEWNGGEDERVNNVDGAHDQKDVTVSLAYVKYYSCKDMVVYINK